MGFVFVCDCSCKRLELLLSASFDLHVVMSPRRRVCAVSGSAGCVRLCMITV